MHIEHQKRSRGSASKILVIDDGGCDLAHTAHTTRFAIKCAIYSVCTRFYLLFIISSQYFLLREDCYVDWQTLHKSSPFKTRKLIAGSFLFLSVLDSLALLQTILQAYDSRAIVPKGVEWPIC